LQFILIQSAFFRANGKQVEKLINNVVKSGKKWYLIYKFDQFKAVRMQHFIGTYECKADAKGRIMMPVALKGQLAASLKNGFVLKRAVFNKCLELYPMQEWEALMQKVNSLNRFNKKNNDFIRRFTAGVKLVEMDASGRLLIPKDLIHYATIQKEVVISSAVSILEIWNKDHYEQAIDEATLDFGDLAEEVMGDQDDSNLS